MEIRYQFSPSLVNQYSLFLNEEGYEKEGEKIPFVTFNKLIDSINKVPYATTEAQQKGIDFENEVIEMAKGGENILTGKSEEYRRCAMEIVGRLPSYFTAQKKVQRQHKDILFYGFCDVVGAGRVIDIKTSAQAYSFGKFLKSHQNLYLWTLEKQGYTTMEYLQTNFRNVYLESYGLDYDFNPLLEQMEDFSEFCEEYRNLIVNEKIFNYRYGVK